MASGLAIVVATVAMSGALPAPTLARASALTYSLARGPSGSEPSLTMMGTAGVPANYVPTPRASAQLGHVPYCNPAKHQLCPGGVACPKCGTDRYACPDAPSPLAPSPHPRPPAPVPPSVRQSGKYRLSHFRVPCNCNRQLNLAKLGLRGRSILRACLLQPSWKCRLVKGGRRKCILILQVPARFLAIHLAY